MKVLEPTVFEVRQDKTDLQIKALRERREQQAEALEALRHAVCKLYRKESVLYADIEQFLLFSHNPQTNFWMERSKLREKIKQEAFGLWLKLEGGKLKIKPEFAESALGFVPDEVQGLTEAWEAVDKLGTENPRRYWSDTAQQFKTVPVTATEQNEIERRNTMMVHKPELKPIIEKLRQEVQLLNLSNIYHDAGINMAKIRQTRPELVPFLGRKDVGTVKGLKTTEFFLNEKMLLHSANPDYKAFDEQ
ncbi:hypothetical protein [Phaeodactylibacter luteus]|uniref:Uncharacterized protein n=1 Tax=Phaeodactylibacter luteus TaxID=1564516 RepID=A0A5C6RH50_9BACT|nr:hypothetical protein [Phaeodactylibacter luteus]TXB61641.1 hypothetical protein FRY97_18125 [Phaeodactylibacter luteus]